jgi:ketosteroid isomerase-like protein
LIKRNVLPAALVVCGLVVVLSLAGCQQAKAPTNLAEGHAAATPTPAKIDTDSIETELIKLEREWANAFKTGDADVARRVMADDVTIINPDGSPSSKADEVQAIQDKLVTMESWEILEPKVVVLDANNAFVTGRGVIKNGKSKIPGSKQTIDISGEYRFLDVYARRNGAWYAVASQTTPIRKDQ